MFSRGKGLALSVSCVLLALGAAEPARSQEASPPSSVQVAPAASVTAVSPLARDARLRVPVTIAPQVSPLSDVLPQIKRTTHVNVYTHPLAPTSQKCQVACTNKSAASLMDALASLCLSRWLRDDKRGYEFRDGDPITDQSLPRTQSAWDFQQSGMRFVKGMEALPDEQRSALMKRAVVAVTDLPEPMMQSIKDHIKAMDEQLREGSPHYPDKGLVAENLDDCTVQVTTQQNGLSTVYYLGIYWGRTEHSTNGGFCFPFNDFPERKAEIDKRIASGDPSIIVTRRFEAMPQAKELPELKQIVKIKANKATLGEVLQQLHESYGVDYVADAPQRLSGVASFNIGPLPLADALDRLTEQYPETEWEWRSLGFLVVRGFANPARSSRYNNITFAENANHE